MFVNVMQRNYQISYEKASMPTPKKNLVWNILDKARAYKP